MRSTPTTDAANGQVFGSLPDTNEQTGTSVARRVLAVAAALYEFFETMLFVHDADPLHVAGKMITKHRLNQAEKLFFVKVAERAGRAKAIVNALEQRFGVRVGGGSLQGRTIEDKEGVTNYVLGSGGKSTLHAFSHNIALGFEKDRWNVDREPGVVGYVESIIAAEKNPLVFGAVETVRRNQPADLGPLAYRAKARRLLPGGTFAVEAKLLRAVFGGPDMSELEQDRLFCEIMCHEIRHVIDHILDAEICLPDRTVEVQAHLYECGQGLMRGFERDLNRLAERERQIREYFGVSRRIREPNIQRTIEARQSLEAAASIFGELRRRLGDGMDHQMFSYVFSLVRIEHLPVVLQAVTKELGR